MEQRLYTMPCANGYHEDCQRNGCECECHDRDALEYFARAGAL